MTKETKLTMTDDDLALYLSYMGTMEDIERELDEAEPEPELNPEALAEIDELVASLGPLPDLRAGRCVNSPDPDLWFREDHESQTKAKAICLSCPVRTLCTQTNDPHGIWGGQDRANQRPCLRGHRGAWATRRDGRTYCLVCNNERQVRQWAAKKGGCQ